MEMPADRQQSDQVNACTGTGTGTSLGVEMLMPETRCCRSNKTTTSMQFCFEGAGSTIVQVNVQVYSKIKHWKALKIWFQGHIHGSP